MSNQNLPGPSGLCAQKSRKLQKPISVEEAVHLLENYPSSSEVDESNEKDVSSSDDEPMQVENERQTNSDNSSEDLEYQAPLPRSRNQYRTRARSRGTGRARGRARGRGRQQQRPPRLTDAQLGWTDVDEDIDLPPFIAIPGVNLDPQDSPYRIFRHFFDDNVLNTIKHETNNYASAKVVRERRRTGELKRRSILDRWRAVGVGELKIFFAIIIHMALVVKPKFSHYWSLSTLYASKFCKSVGISRDRFVSILSMLHINSNANERPAGEVGHDPLHKLRPFHDSILRKFRSAYTPNENLTVDEGMCPFRGRLRFRVYIKGKPHKYGIKLYMVCESGSGYCCNFEVYTGQNPEDENYNSVPNLMARLLEPYINKGYTIYMDRYFPSPNLFDSLWEKKIKCVGTVMSNRQQMPKDAFGTHLAKGDQMFRRRHHLLAIKWLDKRDVYMLSSIHKAEMRATIIDHQPDDNIKLKPIAVLDYNKNKAGVDRSDQLLAYNSFRRKTIKWWRKLFFHFLDLVIANSLILYNKCNPQSKLTLLKFYEKVCDGFLEEGDAEIENNTQDHSADVKNAV